MKPKELKQHEAQMRVWRALFIHEARHLMWYKEDVKAGRIQFHKDDMRAIVRGMREAMSIMRKELTHAELTALFNNHAEKVPLRYRGFLRDNSR